MTRRRAPRVVTANPEFGWFSIDDVIWLAWMIPDAPGDVAQVEEAQSMLRPLNDIGKRHALGWIDVTSGSKHKVESLDPLTISPSILCAQGCGFHGFVREGKWVPA